ncbi:hypothetical protein J3F83DRAFT_348738 [Trichoderma novae-zelandiae]
MLRHKLRVLQDVVDLHGMSPMFLTFGPPYLRLSLISLSRPLSMARLSRLPQSFHTSTATPMCWLHVCACTGWSPVCVRIRNPQPPPQLLFCLLFFLACQPPAPPPCPVVVLIQPCPHLSPASIGTRFLFPYLALLPCLASPFLSFPYLTGNDTLLLHSYMPYGVRADAHGLDRTDWTGQGRPHQTRPRQKIAIQRKVLRTCPHILVHTRLHRRAVTHLFSRGPATEPVC